MGASVLADSMRRTSRRPQPRALTASSSLYDNADPTDRSLLQRSSPAERELWTFYDNLGEFGGFVDWVSRAMSLVRLSAAEELPGGDEPAPLSDGPAAQLMEDWYGGGSGQSTFMHAAAQNLVVPGECWAVPQRFDLNTPLSMADWSVHSRDTFRSRGSSLPPEIEVAPGVWRPIMPDALPVRIWIPHPRFPYLARSPSLAALPFMRRIDLIDRRITAEMLSRLAMNGILWLPAEASIPLPSKYMQSDHPFMTFFLEVVQRNIAEPGSASAAVPIPVRWPKDMINDIKLTKFADVMDEQLLVGRDKELTRLAQSLPLSRERQQGFSDANHWNGLIVSEDDLKISIGPLAQIIADGVAKGWLQPMLAAAGLPLVGPNGGKITVVPDYSELVANSDNKEAFKDMYGAGVVSATAWRREAGASEADMPTPAEQREMILLGAARNPATFAQAYELITGVAPPAAQTPTAGAPIGPDAAQATPPSPAAGSAPPAVGPIEPEPAPTAITADGLAPVTTLAARRSR